MANERWCSPFPHTIAYNLFKKHFTELNQVYWSFVPAYNTIVSKAKKELVSDEADPKSYFLIRDEDDRRIAPSFGEWKNSFSEFSNYSRLNMIMLLSSCFETYLRTVISNAFESKPGVIIMCPDSVDGVFLLKTNISYGNSNDKNYQFTDHIENICQGDWAKRFLQFEKYFGKLPDIILDKTQELDEFRVLRNNIGHYFGRNKSEYSTPLLFHPISAIRVSHKRVLKFLKLINNVAKELDIFLKEKYIGSYDVIKQYINLDSEGYFEDNRPGVRAREFQKLLGREGLPIVGNEYYRNIIDYCNLDQANESCRYSKKACILEINRQLKSQQIQIIYNDRAKRFGDYYFNLFIRAYSWKSNSDYCRINPANPDQTEYRYSIKLINEIVSIISESPDTIIGKLKEKLF